MKSLRLTLYRLLLLGLLAVFPNNNLHAQGVFVFSNNGGNGGALAPLYGPDPANPSLQLWGNTPTARPPGTQSYSGSPLLGSQYSVEAWYSLTGVADVFRLIPDARPVADSLASFPSPAGPGIFSAGSRTIPDPNPAQPPGEPFYVYLQVRAWDNAGGRYPTWTDAWNAANQGSGRAVGWSAVFYQPLDAPNSTQPWPGLINFQSFNLFIVPEPGSVSLLVLGAAVLCIVRWSRPR